MSSKPITVNNMAVAEHNKRVFAKTPGNCKACHCTPTPPCSCSDCDQCFLLTVDFPAWSFAVSPGEGGGTLTASGVRFQIVVQPATNGWFAAVPSDDVPGATDTAQIGDTRFDYGLESTIPNACASVAVQFNQTVSITNASGETFNFYLQNTFIGGIPPVTGKYSGVYPGVIYPNLDGVDYPTARGTVTVERVDCDYSTGSGSGSGGGSGSGSGSCPPCVSKCVQLNQSGVFDANFDGYITLLCNDTEGGFGDNAGQWIGAFGGMPITIQGNNGDGITIQVHCGQKYPYAFTGIINNGAGVRNGPAGDNGHTLSLPYTNCPTCRYLSLVGIITCDEGSGSGGVDPCEVDPSTLPGTLYVQADAYEIVCVDGVYGEQGPFPFSGTVNQSGTNSTTYLGLFGAFNPTTSHGFSSVNLGLYNASGGNIDDGASETEPCHWGIVGGNFGEPTIQSQKNSGSPEGEWPDASGDCSITGGYIDGTPTSTLPFFFRNLVVSDSMP